MWTKFPLHIKVPVIASGILSILAGIFLAAKYSSGWDNALFIWSAGSIGIFLFVLIILLIIRVPYNKLAINVDTKQIRFGKKEFRLDQVVETWIAVTSNGVGQVQIDLLLKTDAGDKGKVAITLPFQKTRTLEELLVLRNAIPNLNIPVDYVGNEERHQSAGGIKALYGRQQLQSFIETRIESLYPESGITPTIPFG